MGLQANEWQCLQGGIADGSDLAAVVRGDRLDCFVRGTDGGLWVRAWDGKAWLEWQSLGGVMTASPAAVAVAADRVDCFVRGTDDGLWLRSLRGDRWAEWQKLEGKLAGRPAAIAHEGGRADCLVRGEDGRLWCRSWDGNWYDLAGGLAADPAVVSSRPTHLDCFVKGTDGALWQRSWAGRWSDWASLGGGIEEDPAAIARGGGAIDVLVRGHGNHRLWHRGFDGERWGEWVDLAGGLASRPGVASRGRDNLEVFVRGTDDALWRRAWDGTRWSEWESLGGRIASAPAPVVTASGELVVFAVGSDHSLWVRTVPAVAQKTAAPASVRPSGVIDTGALLGVAVERLNRQSVVGLLQQVVAEVDEHCRTFPGLVDAGVLALRRELTAQIDALRVNVDRYQVQIGEINAALLALKVQYGDFLAKFEVDVGGIVHNSLAVRLPDIITQVNAALEVSIQQKIDAAVTRVDVTALLAQLEALNAKITILKKAADELDTAELKQVEQLLRALLLDIDLSTVLVNMRVEIGGVTFRLDELLAILAGGDKVAQVDLVYGGDDIAGARFVLVDRVEVQFTCTRHELPGGALEYRFHTPDWKGVPAGFTLRFRRRTLQMTMCKRALALDSYDVVGQTNVVFDLRPPAKPRIPECEVPPTIAPKSGGSEAGPAPEEPVELINGSFEEGPEPGSFIELASGDARVKGWTAGGAGVDYIGSLWQPGDALRRSVDLNHLGPGSVEQTIRTVPGATYKVAWAMAGNPGGAPANKTMTVTANGGSAATYSFDTRGKSFTNMGWLEKWYTFAVTTSTTVLKFTSTTPGAFGPVIDGVKIVRLK